jgi:large conductance mechanosensitive channel
MKGFREFLLRGNVIDLAIAVVIGAAFIAVVNAFVKDIITPLIGIPGHLNLASNAFTINGSTFAWGDLVTVLVNFAIVAAVIYFLVVRPVQHLMELRAKPATDLTTRDCPECLSTIPKAARRCAFCTAEIAAAA